MAEAVDALSRCGTGPGEAAFRTLRVVQRQMLAERIVGLVLQPADGMPVAGIEPGAHLELSTTAGPRAYSLCNAPGDTEGYRIAVLLERAGRGGSAAMHALGLGQTVQASAPRQRFPLVEDADSSVLIAGGIGITPLLPMAERLHALGRRHVLHYSVGRREDAALLSRACSAGAVAQGRLVLHLTREAGGARMDVTAALGAPAPGRHAYVCGPSALIDAVRSAADALGWPAEQVHWEHFSAAAPVVNSGQSSGDAAAPGDRAFEVILQRRRRTVTVGANESVVEALAAQGIDVPVSCAQGVCGTCLTTVLSGRIDHRDLFLTPAEQADGSCFLPCCSRALGDRLVLDL